MIDVADKTIEISRHVLIADEFGEHILTAYCKCGVDTLKNRFYSSAKEDTVTEEVHLHTQLHAHQDSTYMTLTFSEGKQVDNRTLQPL